MKRAAVAAACGALALLTYFQFPGHTYLQQDTQIYVPILEHLRDPAVLRNDIIVQHPHVAYTFYDEATLLPPVSIRDSLVAQQIATRALGIWGLYLMATALGLSFAPALVIAAICSLGITIVGPAVLTFEYEPSPRAFAVPLMLCAVGLAAHRRLLAAGIAGACAFLYHAPTTWPFWAVFAVLAVWRRRWWALAPLGIALAVLLLAAHGQSEQSFFARLTPLQEHLQRMRAAYVWISEWRPAVIWHWVILFAIALLAWARVRRAMPAELQLFACGLPLLGILSMPVSWLLLEQWKWGLAPQVQPMRALLLVALLAQFLSAAAGMRRPLLEAAAWFSVAYLLTLQPVFTQPLSLARAATAIVLGLLTAGALRASKNLAPLAAAAAFFAIPTLGGVVNYPQLHTPELAQLSAWARSSTPQDAVFLFPDAGRALYPGIFRSEALRAVYVDWKGGGQVNYVNELGEEWWFRWQQTMERGFHPADLPRYDAFGIGFIVLRPKNRLPQAPSFENGQYLAYQIR